jgi:putative inorganic carbon (HCO3(-)) transporter
MRDLLIALVWIGLMPLILTSAHVGVLLWVWVALLSPNDLLYGFMAEVPFNKILAVITITLIVVGKEKKDPYLDSSLVFLLLFGLEATGAWANAIAPSDDGTDLYFKLVKIISLTFIITALMKTRHRINLLLLTVTISVGFLIVKEGLIGLLTAGGHKILGNGAFGDNNSVAVTVLMVIPLIYYLARYSAVPVVKIGLFIVLGLSVTTVVMTFSRGGFVGLLVLGAFILKNSRNKFAGLAIVCLAGGLTYLLAPDTWFDRLNTIETADNDGSFMGRVVAWKISWLIAADHPLFGGGMHAVQRLLVWDTYKPLLYHLDFISTPPADDVPHAAHSIYFEVLGDMGFLGLTLFLGMLGSAFWNCSRLYNMARHEPSLIWAADLARMLQVTLIVYLVTAAALSMAYFELIYIVIAIASRCRRTVSLSLAAECAAAIQQTVGAAPSPGPVRPWQRRPARWTSAPAGQGSGSR